MSLIVRPWQRTIRRRWEPHGTPDPQKMERWLGTSEVAAISECFRHWPGPPVALGSVPGNAYVTAGGEFIGHIDVGAELSHLDMAEALVQRAARRRFFRAAHSAKQLGAFGNLSAVLAAVTAGKMQSPVFQKTDVAANAVGNTNELWTRGGQPVAGAAGAAAPGGTATTSATAGALGYSNPTNANTGHHLGGWVVASVLGQFLLVDQLFRVAKTMNSTATEAVTGTFSRYQNQTATAGDYIGGNFCYPAVPTTVLPATAHNWTVCQYTNQAGTAAKSFGSGTGVSACVVAGVDLSVNNWFMPLASGDVGVKALTQMQCSALVATGTIDFVVAHAIGLYSNQVANLVTLLDTLTTALSQLTPVYDNACLTFLSLLKQTTTAPSVNGIVAIVAE